MTLFSLQDFRPFGGLFDVDNIIKFLKTDFLKTSHQVPGLWSIGFRFVEHKTFLRFLFPQFSYQDKKLFVASFSWLFLLFSFHNFQIMFFFMISISGRIRSGDQLFPLYIVDRMSSVPGICSKCEISGEWMMWNIFFERYLLINDHLRPRIAWACSCWHLLWITQHRYLLDGNSQFSSFSWQNQMD